MNNLPTRKTLLAATLAASISLPAAAQNVLEEVIVVAQKREESLQDTVIAITALGSETLDNLNISNSSDFEAVVPSLSVRNAPRRLFLRGVGRVTNSLGTDPGIALYIDQVYTDSIGSLSRASSLTMERVEVLRGPQGTLYGRNATGGAVNIISKRPTEEFEHHVRAKAGDYGLFNWGVSSSGPITDDLGYRVHAYRNKRDGFVDNKSGDDIMDQDHDGFGVQLSWDVTDTLNVWLKYQKDETDDIRGGIFPGGFLITPYVTDEESLDGAFLNEGYQWTKENPSVRDQYKVDLNDPLETETDNNNRYTTHITWDLPSITLKYVGNYSESDYTADNGDFGYTSRQDIRVVEYTEDNIEFYSHELQFLSATDGPLQWVGGIYYRHEDRDQPYGIRTLTSTHMANVSTSGFPIPGTVQPNPGLWGYLQNADLTSETTAAYFDGNYTFNETWKLTAGLRYSYDEKKGKERQFIALDSTIYGLPVSEDCCGILFVDPATANQRLDDDWDNVSGRVVLDYMYSDDQMMYASISTGYKSGGFRLGTIQENPYFDEETVLSYEIGYKGSFNGVFQLNAAAYYYDYSDMQVLVGRLLEEDLGISLPEMVNADEAEVKGLEIEAIWLATDSLTLMANYSYTDGEFEDFCCYYDEREFPPPAEPFNQDLSGNALPQAPENKIFLNASYSLRTDSWGEFVPSVSYSWVDERQFDVFDTDSTLADDYYRVDAMVTWFSPSQDIRIIGTVRNLTDEETWESLERVGTQGAVVGIPNEPRSWAVEVQYDF
ncbi:MAG: TonB-dependent receptor [Haliea sp.]|jgi:iron complex outermembrane receptor protein|nr:TonB-dependent receptor [Haliea sp.]